MKIYKLLKDHLRELAKGDKKAEKNVNWILSTMAKEEIYPHTEPIEGELSMEEYKAVLVDPKHTTALTNLDEHYCLVLVDPEMM